MSAEDEAGQIELAKLRHLEVAACIEAVTLLLLIGVAVLLKYLAGYANAVQK